MVPPPTCSLQLSSPVTARRRPCRASELCSAGRRQLRNLNGASKAFVAQEGYGKPAECAVVMAARKSCALTDIRESHQRGALVGGAWRGAGECRVGTNVKSLRFSQFRRRLRFCCQSAVDISHESFRGYGHLLQGIPHICHYFGSVVN